jgi:hypothetical protein
VNVAGLTPFDFTDRADTPESRLQPDSPVSLIRFFSPTDQLTTTANLRSWRGFRRWQREEVGYANTCGL